MNIIIKNIPNSITCLNLLSGCLACIVALNGQFEYVALFIALSAVFDFFDGFSSRLLHAYSALGKELDSLADLISFGLAPGLTVLSFLKIHADFPGAGTWAGWLPYVALMIPVFSGLRLAKFNIDTRQTTSFIGLPVPANALFWLGICFGSVTNGYLILAGVVVFSYLLVSEIPMFSLKMKTVSIKENYRQYILLLSAIALLCIFGIKGLSAIIGLYILLSLLTIRRKATKME